MNVDFKWLICFVLAFIFCRNLVIRCWTKRRTNEWREDIMNVAKTKGWSISSRSLSCSLHYLSLWYPLTMYVTRLTRVNFHCPPFYLDNSEPRFSSQLSSSLLGKVQSMLFIHSDSSKRGPQGDVRSRERRQNRILGGQQSCYINKHWHMPINRYNPLFLRP
jgi:hypothetical protein